MATVTTRDAYFETGLEVLADLGYGGLKLAEVCRRLRVTTGSFYHYFDNWQSYTQQLLQHWQDVLTAQRIRKVLSLTDPRARIDACIDIGLNLPHGAEAAIRVWSSLDPHVRAAQEEVDRLRYEIIYNSALELLHDERQAQVYANCSLYLLVGYEQCTLPRDGTGLAWIVEKLVLAMDSGAFATVPPFE